VTEGGMCGAIGGRLGESGRVEWVECFRSGSAADRARVRPTDVALRKVELRGRNGTVRGGSGDRGSFLSRTSYTIDT
jgi:hypothetical protein